MRGKCRDGRFGGGEVGGEPTLLLWGRHTHEMDVGERGGVCVGVSEPHSTSGVVRSDVLIESRFFERSRAELESL